MILSRYLTRGLAAAALLTTTSLGAFALDLSDMSSDERAAFRAEVRAYLLENPEVLMEAVDVYNQRQQAAQAQGEQQLIAAHADDIFHAEHDLVMGNPEGSLTFVEFLDYNCGYCKKAHPEVQSLLDTDGDIRLIVKEYPILGEGSVLAARFALATKFVAGTEAYAAIHDMLMESRSAISEASLARMASDLDLDADAINAAMDSDEVNAVLAENQRIGAILQVTGTPSFIMGDQMVRGYVPIDAMLEIVDELRG
ncbi:DsbA family protein [Celeribacter sp.]|uniref:DsbA family protein n=1 Tax=Celeribacter sp. TaxID=1890673 RepID=UPI003A94A855